ncbi:MAG: amino acid permease [Anaerolineae bacterium]|nr:MAG: amino acid permease [Anaerolineae bacterium]
MEIGKIKRWIIGEPFPTSADIHERLDNIRGLAIFASDPISSNAYATEAIMSVLIVLGSGALSLTLPLALGVAGLVTIVVFSYIQIILHYPKGGGGYRVTRDNLGTAPALLVAAALLTDYILTVSVSVSAGVRAITSAFPQWHDHRVALALSAIFLITLINLRGVRESGTIFALPTYAFVGGVMVVIVVGLVRYFGLFGAPPLEITPHIVPPQRDLSGFLYVWLLLRAFAAGCTALTGIEAISDGVASFKPPEAVNAAKTMFAMGVMAMSLFAGISFLSTHMSLIPEETNSILSQMTEAVAGRGFLYYWVQAFTMLILVLAANTGFQDFPRLSSFLAQDGFMPRWMANRGDRLVFSSGILTLAFLSSLVVIVFHADEFAMLPLYALGVMVSFTFSQVSMVRLMGRIGKLKPGEKLKTRFTEVVYERGWRWKQVLSAFGSLVTFVVLVVLVATKFLDGAWIVVLAIPLLVRMFYAINSHYKDVASNLRTRDLVGSRLVQVADVAIVPIGDVHKGTLRALQYARRLASEVRAVCVVTSEEQKERLLKRWNRFPELTGDVQLLCIDYDFRDVLEPVIEYIEKVKEEEFPDEMLTVVLPEFIAPSLATQLLHNQSANILRLRLRGYPNIIVVDIPFHIYSRMDMEEREQAEQSSDEVPSQPSGGDSSADTQASDAQGSP